MVVYFLTIFLILMTNFGINQYKFFVHWFKRLALQIGLLVLHYRILTSFWVILNLLDLLHPYQNLALFLWIGVHNSTYSTNFYPFVIILPTVLSACYGLSVSLNIDCHWFWLKRAQIFNEPKWTAVNVQKCDVTHNNLFTWPNQ